MRMISAREIELSQHCYLQNSLLTKADNRLTHAIRNIVKSKYAIEFLIRYFEYSSLRLASVPVLW